MSAKQQSPTYTASTGTFCVRRPGLEPTLSVAYSITADAASHESFRRDGALRLGPLRVSLPVAGCEISVRRSYPAAEALGARARGPGRRCGGWYSTGRGGGGSGRGAGVGPELGRGSPGARQEEGGEGRNEMWRRGGGGEGGLSGKIETEVEILNPWRYAAIIVARRMTHRTRGTRMDRIRDRLSRDGSSATYCCSSTVDSFLQRNVRNVCVSCAANSWSDSSFPPPIRTAPIQVRQSLRPLSAPVAEHTSHPFASHPFASRPFTSRPFASRPFG